MQEWYYLIDGEQVGPVSKSDLQELIENGMLLPEDLVWTEGMADWLPVSQAPLSSPPKPQPAWTNQLYPQAARSVADRDYQQFVSNKVAAGLCGILLGPLGVHKFILGLTTPGVIMLVISLLTCGLGSILTGPIGLIEGIIYLTKSDEEFYELYAVQKRGWF